MSEAVPPLPEPAPDARPRGSKRRLAWRWGRRLVALVIALVAGLVVFVFSIDLGRAFPQIRTYAEQQGSKWLERPMHIGRISALITPGRFAIDDVVIEGRSPGDRPFFRADRIYVHVPWWTMFRREIHVQLELTNWAMVVESWEGGRHNVPRLKGPPRPPSTRKGPFNTRLDWAYARGGSFTYEDHATPWRVVAPNLDFDLVWAGNLRQYVGTSRFDRGTVQIQSYEPMATAAQFRFFLDLPHVKLQHIDLTTDGSESHVSGDVDFSNWPDQVYNVNSTVDFARMKRIFFAHESWRLGGTGEFTGVFRILKSGGRDLSGEFHSALARVNDLEFPDLHGTLTWTADRFAVTHADSQLLGGHTRFSYAIAPLGTKTGARATFAAEYSDVDLFDLNRLLNLRGLRIAGTGSGTLELGWPNGHFGTGRSGRGHTRITPPAGTALAPAALPAVPLAPAVEPAPFDPNRRTGPLTLGADLHYAIDADGVTFDESSAATSLTFVRFSGRLGGSRPSAFPFHVTSHDWQESDRLLASIMSAISGPTGAIEIGGRGTFDGTMTGTFSDPRIAGRFVSEGTRVWDVTWGAATADAVIQGGYVEIANSRIMGEGDGLIDASGRFALGFRKDDRDEIAAHVSLRQWPIAVLRHAFQLDDWPMEGMVAQANLDLTGKYRAMFGTGQLRIERGTAWKERFDWATADLELEGAGMSVRRIDMQKGDGRMHGSAHIGWDGTYAFDADGDNVEVEHLDNFQFPQTPLTGRLRFTARGGGRFDAPDYEFEGAIDDLFVADEGIGPVTGRIHVTGNRLSIERMLVLSSRLTLEGTGTIDLDDQSTSNLRFRFQRASLDPYLKFVGGAGISPYTRMIVSGTVNVRGPLSNANALTVETSIDEANLTLFDYDLRNQEPVRLTMENGRFSIGSLRLGGEGTNLQVRGGADTLQRQWNLEASGDASLSILQLFRQFRGITASGGARLDARITGSFDQPELSGGMTLTDARLRPIDSPHSLEAINGRLTLVRDAILLNDMTARIGSGEVALGGRLGLSGFGLTEYSLTARGRSMRLRYPTGFNSTVDMDLSLAGPIDAPRLSGTVDVLRVSYLGQADPSASIFGLAAGGAASATPLTAVPTAIAPEGTSLALDIQVTAPRMPVIDTNVARIEAGADVRVRGTFAKPDLSGSLQIAGGQVLFNGNRYYVREGWIEFSPDRPEPEFNVSAEARPRVSGQVFTVDVQITGTFNHLTPTLTSDPWLPETEVINLLLGGRPEVTGIEQRALAQSQELQQQMLQRAGAVLLTAPLSARVGSVLERTGAVDVVQISPVLANETAFSQLNPSARVTLMKRISPRAVLTYSRTLSGPQDEVILLEYDQSDRWSWVLSRNEDRSFALDFRIRYVF